MAIRHLRNRVTREVFVPALRLFRDTLLNHPDPVALREWAGRLEAALVHDSDVAASRPIALGHCAASWFEAPFTDARRVILYLHGGAFVVETPRLHGAFVTRLAAATGCGVLVPHYRLAPEHPFPAAHDDALTAYRWLLDSGREGREIAVAGDSAGGNLTLGLLQRIVHEGLPAPACAVALSPITDGPLSGESIRRNDGLDPMFTAAGFHALVPLVLPDAAQRAWPLASLLFGEMAGLPPLLLQVGSSELLLDDSIRFAQRCPGARLQVWHDMPHVFPLFEFLPQASAALADIARFIDHQLPPTGGPRGTEIQRTDRQGLCPADGSEVAGGALLGRG